MKLTKSDLFQWGLVPEYSTSGMVPVLSQDPYAGMAILFGEIHIYENGVKFDYLILKNPNDRVVVEDQDFHKYLEDVVQTIIGSQNDKANKTDIP
jgi:hypothetical protein